MKVIGYILQVEGDSRIPEWRVQQEELETYGTRQGWKFDSCVVEDGVSPGTAFEKRVEGARILAELEDGDILVVTRAALVLSSARNGLQLLATLEEKGVALYCLDLDENISLPEERKLAVSQGQAEFVRNLLSALAFFEDGSTTGRKRSAKKKMSRKGRYTGGPVPFGWYVKNGLLKKDKEQQKIIRQMKKWRADRWSYRDISLKLKENMGIHLSHEGIRKVLMKRNDV